MHRRLLRRSLSVVLSLSMLLVVSTRTRNRVLGLVGAESCVIAPHRSLPIALGVQELDRLDCYFRDGYTRAWHGRGFK